MTPEIALQTAVRMRLVEWAALAAMVPALSILDRNERPAPDPSIIIGEGQSRDEGDSMARDRTTVFLDLHVWKKEPSTEGVKAIGGEIRKAIHSRRLDLTTGFHCVDCHVDGTRWLRDPDGETSHGVVTLMAIVKELA